MNSRRYFIPNMGMPIIYNIPFRSMPFNAVNGGLLGKLFNGTKVYNWKSLLSNANKTLNVVNQTIPLIRQAGPMINNVRNITKLVRAFGNEVGNKKKSIVNTSRQINVKSKDEYIANSDNNYPTFFV